MKTENLSMLGFVYYKIKNTVDKLSNGAITKKQKVVSRKARRYRRPVNDEREG